MGWTLDAGSCELACLFRVASCELLLHAATATTCIENQPAGMHPLARGRVALVSDSGVTCRQCAGAL